LPEGRWAGQEARIQRSKNHAGGSLNGDREEYRNPVWSEDELPPAHP
jgi:hypothetical protein